NNGWNCAILSERVWRMQWGKRPACPCGALPLYFRGRDARSSQAGGPRHYFSAVPSVSRNSPRSFQSAHESYLWQLAGLSFAAQMDEGLGSADAGFAPAPGRDDFMVLAPDALAVLAEVREQGPLLLVQHG